MNQITLLGLWIIFLVQMMTCMDVERIKDHQHKTDRDLIDQFSNTRSVCRR